MATQLNVNFSNKVRENIFAQRDVVFAQIHTLHKFCNNQVGIRSMAEEAEKLLNSNFLNFFYQIFLCILQSNVLFWRSRPWILMERETGVYIRNILTSSGVEATQLVCNNFHFHLCLIFDIFFPFYKLSSLIEING